jgi:hypothetical protein
MRIGFSKLVCQEALHFPVGKGHKVEMSLGFDGNVRQPFKMAERNLSRLQDYAFGTFMHDKRFPSDDLVNRRIQKSQLTVH